MKKLSIETRLQAIEAKQKPKRLSISLGHQCNKIEDLPALVERCKQRNTPESCVFHYPAWVGEPNEEAAALVGEIGYHPDKYQKKIVVSHAERIGCE